LLPAFLLSYAPELCLGRFPLQVSLGSIPLPMLGRGGLTTLVPLQLIIIAVVMSTLIGIVAGLMPARAASKLNPVEALRYE